MHLFTKELADIKEWAKMKNEFKVIYFVCALFLMGSGNSYGEDIDRAFFQEIGKRNLQVTYLAREKKVIISGGVVSKNISGYLFQYITKSMKEVGDAIHEDCPKKGTYELNYEFNHVTENFASFKRIVTYYDCYVTNAPNVDYVNIFNYHGELMMVDFNLDMADSLKYHWDEDCNAEDISAAYSLLVNSSGKIEVNVYKSQVCDLNLKIRNEKKYITFKKVDNIEGM